MNRLRPVYGYPQGKSFKAGDCAEKLGMAREAKMSDVDFSSIPATELRKVMAECPAFVIVLTDAGIETIPETIPTGNPLIEHLKLAKKKREANPGVSYLGRRGRKR